MDAIARAGLFDAAWFGRTYGDGPCGPAGDPLVHWCNTGWAAGLDPNAYFETAWYLETNPDVAARGVNPLLHYLRHGEAEDRAPSPSFDPAWYRARHGIAPGAGCLADFLARRADPAPPAPDPSFDAAWYRARHPDEPEVARDPFAHWLRVGRARGRPGSAAEAAILESGLFDPEHYAVASGHAGAVCAAPVAHAAPAALVAHYRARGRRLGLAPNRLWTVAGDGTADADPLLDYIADGERGERPGAPVAGGFDAAAYRAAYEVEPGRLALAHRLDRAIRADGARAAFAAGRPPGPAESIALIRASGLFDENRYLSDHPDVRVAGIDPLAHYCLDGEREGRRPNAYFDPHWYARAHSRAPAPECPPLLHYILWGEAAGLRPIVYLDPAWYARTYRVPASISPLRHYLAHRRAQRCSPTPLFDVDRYRRKFGASAGPNRDLFAHFLRVGIGADVDPGRAFDARLHRARHMAPSPAPYRARPGAEVHERVAREALNPLVDFLLAEFDGRAQNTGMPPATATSAPEVKLLSCEASMT